MELDLEEGLDLTEANNIYEHGTTSVEHTFDSLLALLMRSSPSRLLLFERFRISYPKYLALSDWDLAARCHSQSGS